MPGRVGVVVALLWATVALHAQQRPASPEGSAQTQIGPGWIEIVYGRPILRGRTNVFGTGAEYGKAVYDGGPIWRAGANRSTRLRTDMPIEIGGKRVPKGEHVLLIELKSPREWTLVVTAQPHQATFDERNTTDLWGGFNYTPAKDVARAPMRVEPLSYRLDQLTWGFSDVTRIGGSLRIAWDTTSASVPFTIVQ
jgi:hypothetical protein